uniref:Uncharacterized protein n=1 Tax=Arundo donax TaxID=35708 RepID=A0A0A9HJC0_ARUDO
MVELGYKLPIIRYDMVEERYKGYIDFQTVCNNDDNAGSLFVISGDEADSIVKAELKVIYRALFHVEEVAGIKLGDFNFSLYSSMQKELNESNIKKAILLDTATKTRDVFRDAAKSVGAVMKKYESCVSYLDLGSDMCHDLYLFVRKASTSIVKLGALHTSINQSMSSE